MCMGMNQLYSTAAVRPVEEESLVHLFWSGKSQTRMVAQILMQHLLSKAEINPPQEAIHLPDPGCPCQYPKPHAFLSLASPYLHPVQMCSVTDVTLTLCSLPPYCKRSSLQSKTQSSTLPSLFRTPI